jgi:hypothetical protein
MMIIMMLLLMIIMMIMMMMMMMMTMMMMVVTVMMVVMRMMTTTYLRPVEVTILIHLHARLLEHSHGLRPVHDAGLVGEGHRLGRVLLPDDRELLGVPGITQVW